MRDIERTVGSPPRRTPHGVVVFGGVALAVVAAGTLAACASGHGGTPDSDGGVPPDGSAPPPVAIETELPNSTIQAGDRVHARCVLLDENGEPTQASGVEPEITYEPMTLFGQDDGGEVIGELVGSATVRCAAPSLGLVDETPEPLEIIPGAPHSVITRLSADTAVAGNSTDVICLAFDAFGNEVTNFDRTVALSPSGSGISVEDQSVTVTRSGLYEVSCNVSAAPELESAFLFVIPGLPASIDASLNPVRDIYTVNDEVAMRTDVRDQFGNRVDDATLEYTADAGVTMTSPGRFQFGTDGVFTLTATVASETLTEEPLFASVQVTVNSSGPDIECLRVDDRTPSDAYMVDGVANSTVPLAVRVADTFGVDQVTIGGVTASDVGSNVFEANFAVRWGMNYARVVATDGEGEQNTRTCAFLASNNWVPKDAHLDGAIALRLDQHAMDDNSSPSPLTSVNNIVELALNSAALIDMVDQALLDANPINDGGCGVFACNPDVTYNGGSLSWGNITSSTQLISGGLRLNITIPNVSADVTACGTTCCIGGSDITVTMDSIVATVDFGLQLQSGQLRASVLGDPTVSVNGVGLAGSGFCGFLIDLLEGTFASMVQDAVRDALGDFISSDLGPLIDDLVSSLDVSTIAPSFLVPRLDGSGDIALGLGLSFSSLSISTQRLLLGLGTQISVDGSSPTASLGVARRAGAVLLDPPGTDTTRPVGLSLHEGVLNQILHALWRGGFFDATLDLGEAQASIEARLPPVAHLDGGQVRLMLGAIRTQVTGLLSEPVWVTFGGTATASVSLNGDNLVFGALQLENDFYVNLDTSIASGDLATLEGLLRDILQDTLGAAINDGLPAIPIPTFTLPPEVAEFGLPAGAEVGITNPQLDTTDFHYVLTGGFGVR